MAAGLLAASIVATALWAPLAQAAAPANDNFTSRELLSSPLPIEVTRSNVEATKEGGEDLHALAPAGHSVWFEWEAPSTGWVTVGACQSDFPELLGVFTGTAVNSLTKVANANSTEGPHCPYRQREYTFKALSGTKYEIAVDGDGFYVDVPPAATVGSFVLRIEATPVPSNDDFVNARNVSGQISEEPGGGRFFFEDLTGYNWNATKESGEPNHAGDPGGASVWYDWTAPASGQVSIGVSLGVGTLLAVYSGGSLGALAPLASTSGFPPSVTVSVSAGSEYHIAVDGLQGESTGEAAMGSFSLGVSMDLPPGPGAKVAQPPALGPPADVVAPKTTVGKHSVKGGERSATFAFSSSEAGGAFRCKLDGRAFAACHPPKTYKNLTPGRHTFKVAAVDAAGNVDATPAVVHFSIPRPRKR
jgi:hypothetical protein